MSCVSSVIHARKIASSKTSNFSLNGPKHYKICFFSTYIERWGNAVASFKSHGSTSNLDPSINCNKSAQSLISQLMQHRQVIVSKLTPGRLLHNIIDKVLKNKCRQWQKLLQIGWITKEQMVIAPNLCL